MLYCRKTYVTYILHMVAIVNYFLYCRNTYVTYILDTHTLEMEAIVNYFFILPQDLCDLHTVHVSDRELKFCIAGRHM